MLVVTYPEACSVGIQMIIGLRRKAAIAVRPLKPRSKATTSNFG